MIRTCARAMAQCKILIYGKNIKHGENAINNEIDSYNIVRVIPNLHVIIIDETRHFRFMAIPWLIYYNTCIFFVIIYRKMKYPI